MNYPPLTDQHTIPVVTLSVVSYHTKLHSRLRGSVKHGQALRPSRRWAVNLIIREINVSVFVNRRTEGGIRRH